MLRAFFHSEQDEAPLRLALDVAAPNWEGAAAHPGKERVTKLVQAFVANVAPRATPKQRRFASELVTVTTGALGKALSSPRRTKAELDHWADEVSTMLMRYLEGL